MHFRPNCNRIYSSLINPPCGFSHKVNERMAKQILEQTILDTRFQYLFSPLRNAVQQLTRKQLQHARKLHRSHFAIITTEFTTSDVAQ